MEEMIIVLLWAAVLIMVVSICSFLKSKKVITEVLNNGNISISGLMSGYLILLLFFTAAYVIYTISQMGDSIEEHLTVLVPMILFWGSVFVFITMYLLKRLLNNLLKAKMNQLDSLTGVLNKEAVKNSVDKICRETCCCHALLLMDLDNFKQVNDQYGHMEGDVVIQNVARIIRDTLPEEDIVGRFGGDEFVALLMEAPPEKAKETANVLKEKIQAFCDGRLPELSLGASIGIAYRNKDGNDTYDKLFERADRAMYASKQSGKNCITEE